MKTKIACEILGLFIVSMIIASVLFKLFLGIYLFNSLQSFAFLTFVGIGSTTGVGMYIWAFRDDWHIKTDR